MLGVDIAPEAPQGGSATAEEKAASRKCGMQSIAIEILHKCLCARRSSRHPAGDGAPGRRRHGGGEGGLAEVRHALGVHPVAHVGRQQPHRVHLEGGSGVQSTSFLFFLPPYFLHRRERHDDGHEVARAAGQPRKVWEKERDKRERMRAQKRAFVSAIMMGTRLYAQ